MKKPVNITLSGTDILNIVKWIISLFKKKERKTVIDFEALKPENRNSGGRKITQPQIEKQVLPKVSEAKAKSKKKRDKPKKKRTGLFLRKRKIHKANHKK